MLIRGLTGILLLFVPICLGAQSTTDFRDGAIRKSESRTANHEGSRDTIKRYVSRESSTPLGMRRPRPYFYSGMSLQENGSAALNYVVGVGIQENTPHFLFDGYMEYSNTRKIDDNTVNNLSGRTRMLYAAPRFRLRNGWFIGPGARWSQLSTTNYVKEGWRPFVGGGKDWRITRLSVDYLWTASEHVSPRGCSVPKGQCTNAVRGFDFKWFMPSPMSRSHVLFRMNFTSFWFHTTVTTTDPVLTRRQTGEIGVGSVLDYTLLLRF